MQTTPPTEHIIPPSESLIEYPSDFPIKIMGPTHVDFAPTML
ncbi:MAG: DUF493 family protein, partial [Janthinobacterium sp.]